MKAVFVFFISALAGLFLVAIVGNVMLDMFPSLQPMWEEAKLVVSDLYHTSVGKYGIGATVVIIICIFIIIGTSRG